MIEFRLTGPRGDNPLGFLTSLGALVTLEDMRHYASLGWDGVTPRLLVNSFSLSGGPLNTDEERRQALVDFLHKALRRERGQDAAGIQQAKKEMEQAKTTLKKKLEDIKSRKLGREEARQARRQEQDPLEKEIREKTAVFKRHLAKSAADPSVTLGKNLTEANAELIEHVNAACEQCCAPDRRWVDLAAAYGVADPALPNKRMMASPWALIRGDSRQDFLVSVQELMVGCTAEHLSQALFGPWEPKDEKHSLRLDAAEDRRYALMDRNPTARGNEPLTLWGANRLAFEALRFFPAMPVGGGMGVRAWRATNANWQEGCWVRWPLWRRPVGTAAIQSLLGLRDLMLEDPAARDRLRGLGVHAVMESRRIASGRKYSLTPATPVWVSHIDDAVQDRNRLS
jgi:hypothetical protein